MSEHPAAFADLHFNPLSRRYPSGRSLVYARHGMVCTSQPLAAGAGLDILKRGGNACFYLCCLMSEPRNLIGVKEPMSLEERRWEYLLSISSGVRFVLIIVGFELRSLEFTIL